MIPESSDLLIEEDSWLTSILGIRSERIRIQSIERYISYWSENRVEYPFFTTIKVDGPLYENPQQQLDGLRFIQEMKLYRWEGLPIHNRENYNIRKYSPDDRSAILGITENAFHRSRFHSDARFSIELAEKIKREWILNNLTSRPNILTLVAEVDNVVVGYSSLLISSGSITIDLIATAKSMRGKGIGASLIRESQQFASLNTKELLVGTQSNSPANSLYLRSGFTNHAIQNVWHHSNRTGFI